MTPAIMAQMQVGIQLGAVTRKKEQATNLGRPSPNLTHPSFPLPLPFQEILFGTSLAVQWLRLHASTAGDTGSIPDGGN